VSGEEDAASANPGEPRFWRRAEFRLLGSRSHQVLVLAAMTGLVTGAIVAGFEYLVDAQIQTRVQSWSLALPAGAPGVGLVGAGLALR